MKSIMITGASRGIGRETAQHFLDHGWRVEMIARSELLAGRSISATRARI